MRIAFFEARCNNCGKVFENPLLSDFSYGDFLARGKLGTVFAYLDALNEPVIKEIENIYKKLFPDYGVKKYEIPCFHFVIGRCSDNIDGQNMRIDIGPVCPYCISNSIDYNNLKKVAIKDIEKLSFYAFLLLDDEEKNSFIRENIISFCNEH